VNAQTRTAKVRIQVPNPDLLLKTDLYATVEIAAPIDSATVLAVPDSAVLDTGTGRLFLLTAAKDASSRARSSSGRAPMATSLCSRASAKARTSSPAPTS